jgi:methylthioribose-1-phosphate isomerase
LPAEETYLDCRSADEVAAAIRDLVVRGAPAIGIAAAWGVVLAARDGPDALDRAWNTLRAARPTAVNLMWALDRMKVAIARGADHGGSCSTPEDERSATPSPPPLSREGKGEESAFFPRSVVSAVLHDGKEHTGIHAGLPKKTFPPLLLLEREAQAIQDEDLAANRRMGELGAALLGNSVGVLTHCNTGSLATSGFGTALGVIRAGVAAGRIERVFAGETRPWLQGARLTVWELLRDGIPVTLIADSAAAHLMKSGAIQWVIVGADRIAANGDVANKIGTYQLAIAARHHGVRFMVVAPASTLDMATASGADIDIELRAPDELLGYAGQRTVEQGAQAWNPVFDVTPAALIDVIVTERGVIERPDRARMAASFGGA